MSNNNKYVTQNIKHDENSSKFRRLILGITTVAARQDARRTEEKLGRVFAGEGDVMEEHERDKVEQNALQVCIYLSVLPRQGCLLCHSHYCCTAVG